MIDKQLHMDIRAAMTQGDVEKVASLIGADSSRLQMMTPFGTWLHVAASFGKLDVVKRLVEMGADVNAAGGTAGGGPLNVAVSDGHIDVVRYLLSHGAKLDVSASEKNPLFSAIYGGYPEIARLLIDAGIDASVKYSGKSIKDRDALAFARERGQSEIADILLSHAKQ